MFKKLKSVLDKAKNFIPSSIENFEKKKYQSIKATGVEYTYDRYDPSYGLHSEPKENENESNKS